MLQQLAKEMKVVIPRIIGTNKFRVAYHGDVALITSCTVRVLSGEEGMS